jgi:HK97 family phage portal protein
MSSKIRDIAIQTAKDRQIKNIGSRLWEAMIIGKGSIMGNPWDDKLIIEQAYERNAPFYAAVNIIAQTIGEMPLYVETNYKGRKGRSDSHPILSLMNRNSTMQEFMERFASYYLVLGKTASQIVKGHKDRPLGLVVMPAQNVRPVQGTYRKPIDHFLYTEIGEQKFDYSEVIFVYKPSLMRYWDALSPAVPLQELIALNNAGITWNKNVAQAGGVPPIIAKAMGLDKAEAEEIKSNWREQSGANKSHELKIMSANLEIEKYNDSPHDAEWSQAILTSMRMIFMTLGVSSSLMNDAANKTYNNVHDARKALYTEGAIPIAKRLLAGITDKLQHYYEDNPVIKIDTDSIDVLQEDKLALAKRLKIEIDSGLITPNEGRKQLGLPPSKDPQADSLGLAPKQGYEPPEFFEQNPESDDTE